MAKLQDYSCLDCSKSFEYLHLNSNDVAVCPACESKNVNLILGGHLLTTIIPAYPGSKRMKAGHQHTHGDRPAEKISSQVPRGPTTKASL